MDSFSSWGQWVVEATGTQLGDKQGEAWGTHAVPVPAVVKIIGTTRQELRVPL